MSEISDFLFAEGGKSFRFETIGDTVKGVIESVEVRQQSDLATGELLTWSDGRKRMQLVITLKTEERDGADDDGVRTIYAKGGRYEIAKGEGSSMRDAIAEAVKEAKASSIEPGDELAVCFTGESKPTQRGFQPAKLYVAGFKKASKSVSASDLFGDGNERSGDPF